MKATYRTCWSPQPPFPPTCDDKVYSHVEDVFEESVVDGVRVLTKIGTTDVYDKIQSYASVCDINQIIERAALGLVDISDNGMSYGDSTVIPTSVLESLEMNKAAQVHTEELMAKVPDEVKELFGSTADEFLKNFDKDKFSDYVKSKVVKETTNDAK